MRIAHVQICAAKGAMSIPARLAAAQRDLGHEAVVVVKWSDTGSPHSLPVLGPDQPGPTAWRVARWALRLKPYVGRVRGAGRLAHLLWHAPLRWEQRRADRTRAQERAQGHEDFEYPATWNLLNRLPWKPDILHLHNLHGHYFDLRALPWLSRQVPTVLTLHDMWLLTGHCAYPLGCERWRTGCGSCPDLTIYPAIEQDSTATNWRIKERLYSESKLHIASAGRWLLDVAQESVLAPHILSSTLVRDGVDVSLFSPGDPNAARARLGLPAAAVLILFVATGFRAHRFKDWLTVRDAAERAATCVKDRTVILVGVGDSAETEANGNLEVRFVGAVKDQIVLRDWYRAADLFVHAAHADTFPGVVLEALACGAPTVATAVDGIAEQVRSLTDRYTPCMTHDATEATGILVAPGDAEAMADACVMLLRDDALRVQLSANAVRDARERFDVATQVRAYLDLYQLARAPGPGHPDLRP